MPFFVPQSLVDDAAAARHAAESALKGIAVGEKKTGELETLIKAAIHLWSGVAQQVQNFEELMSAQMDALAAQVKASADRDAAAATLIAQQKQQIDQLTAAKADLANQLAAAQAESDNAATPLTDQLKAAGDTLQAAMAAAAPPATPAAG